MISTILVILLLIWPAMSFLPGVGNLIARTLGLALDEPTASTGRGANHQRANESSGASSADTASSVSSNARPGAFEPSPMDVLVTKAMLTSGLKLPPEIVLSVLDFAEYWPHTSTVLDHSLIVTSGRGREDKFIVSDASH